MVAETGKSKEGEAITVIPESISLNKRVDMKATEKIPEKHVLTTEVVHDTA